MLFGCATVNVVDESGRPVPDHVVRGSIPATGMRVDFALIRYYGQKEGDEFLDTHEYLNPYDEMHVVKSDHLRSLAIAAQILNPNKVGYRVLLYYDYPDDHENSDPQRLHEFAEVGESLDQEILYEGDLSRKNFDIELPVVSGEEIAVRFELQTTEGLVFFLSPTVRYEVEKRRPAAKAIVTPPITNEDTVTGAALDDPIRSSR
jgi:hypothetical protein